MQTKSYDDLLALTTALIGAGSLTDPEKAQILQFVNRRAHEAYQTSESWPRYMVANEPRTVVANQTVPYAEDSFYVFGAGTSAVNGLYTLSSSQFNSHDVWERTDGSDSYFIRRETHGSNNTWHIVKASSATQVTADAYYYEDGQDGNYPDETGWTVDTDGTAPTPTVVNVANIAEFIRIHRTQPFLNRSALEYDFYTTAQGAHIMNISGGEANIAYVTYKKEFTPFTADSDNIPQEWFYFIAHGAYADFLRVQDKQEEAIAEEQVAGTYLALELEKIDNRVNNTNLVNRFSTYVSRQAR